VIKVTAPLWIGLLIGAGFGGFAELWGIANPETLIRLARWKDRLFIGCISIAAGSGAIALYGLYALNVSMHFSPKPIYIVGVIVGGLLFGVGMAISGYVPGSEWMALGEGRRDALYAVAGGILGAAGWTLVYQTPVGYWLVHTLNFGSLIATGSIHHINAGLTFLIAIPYAVIMFAIAGLLPRYAHGKTLLFNAVTGQFDERERAMMADTVA
jgi:uncharacterized membrane protein YedE/YeeE